MAVRRDFRIGIALVAVLLAIGAVWTARTRAPRARIPSGTPGVTSPAALSAPPTAVADAPPAAPGPTESSPPAVAASGQTDPAAMRHRARSLEPAWREVRLAFGFRELGRVGPYVKTGLDAARLQMEFCYRQYAPDADASARATEPAILMLYLEAREGAIDVVETEVDYPGTQRKELVDCCRDVLRGHEMPAFNVVPGQRYRMKYQLD